MIGKTLDSDEFLENLLEELKLQGFDVSEDSNITKIIKTIAKSSSRNRADINKIIQGMTFDGRTGSMLDDLYEFFGIPRIIKNVTGAVIKVFNNGPYTVDIKSNTFFEIQGNTYRTTVQQYVNPHETNEIYAYPTGVRITDNYSTIGEVKLYLKNISVDNVPESEKEMYVNDYVVFGEFDLSIDTETDLEYKSRAQGLIQHFGDGSITKIKNYIMGIENVSDVKIEKEFGRTKIIIIPEELKYLDKITEQAKEARDYFSSSPIVFDNPSITEIYVSGITEQLTKKLIQNKAFDISEIITGIKMYLSEYVKDLYLNSVSNISRDSIEFTINKYFVDNNILFSLDEDKIKVSYSVYSDEDYSEPIITNELQQRRTKEIKTDIVIVGGVE